MAYLDSCTWSLQVFTNDKAGMGAVDKEKVKKIVYEMSKVLSKPVPEQRLRCNSHLQLALSSTMTCCRTLPTSRTT